nr:odorant receptor 24 [Pachyrhinus yasumatsui]
MHKKKGFLNTPKLYMILYGVWPADQIMGEQVKKFYILYKSVVAIFYHIFAAFLATELVILIVSDKPSERITGSAALVVTVLMLCFKSFIYQKNKVPHMCLTFTEAENDVWKSKDADVQKTYQTSFKWCDYLNTVVIISSCSVVLSFTIYAFFQLYQVGVQGWDFDNMSFMYEMYFPLNKTENFAFMAVFNVWAGLMGIILNIANQTTFYSLIIFAALRFRILQIRIKKFNFFAREFDGNIVLTIKKFIRAHQELIRFVESLNEATKSVMLMEFLLNSVNVASVLIQIIRMQSFLELAFPVFYFALLIMQVFVLGWTANDIKLQSLAIADAIYESPWYEQNEAAKKLLHIMLLRAQRPLVLTIGPFNPMTTETALMTMKASYSYVTLMMKSYEK